MTNLNKINRAMEELVREYGSSSIVMCEDEYFSPDSFRRLSSGHGKVAYLFQIEKPSEYKKTKSYRFKFANLEKVILVKMEDNEYYGWAVHDIENERPHTLVIHAASHRTFSIGD